MNEYAIRNSLPQKNKPLAASQNRTAGTSILQGVLGNRERKRNSDWFTGGP